MARDGNGNYSTPEASFIAGAVIDQDAVNNNFNDIAVALTASIATDGQSTITADLPMDGFKHTGVDDATARNHYAAVGQVQDDAFCWAGTAGGSTSALTLTPSPAIAAYAAGQRFRFIGANQNVKDATLAVSGLAAKAIFFGGLSVDADAIWTGRLYDVVYDGTQFNLQPLSAQGPASKNWIINPLFQVSQQRTTASLLASAVEYVSDQWVYIADGAATVSHETLALAAGFFNYGNKYLRIDTADDLGSLYNINEQALRALSGHYVTLTISAKADATCTITPQIVQNFGTGGAPSAAVVTALSVCTLTTSWARYVRTVFLPSITGKTLGSGGNEHLYTELVMAGNNKTVDIEYVQLESGPTYTPMSPRPAQEEMDLCKRYWQQSYDAGTVPGTVTAAASRLGVAFNTAQLHDGNHILETEMRVAPTVVIYSTNDGATGNGYSATGAANVGMQGTAATKTIFFSSSGTTFTAGHLIQYQWTANARF